MYIILDVLDKEGKHFNLVIFICLFVKLLSKQKKKL